MLAACLLAFCTGFLSLSLEILWIRLFSFANHSMPQAFSFVLAMYLIGIALGARLGKFFCGKQVNLWLVCGVALILSSVNDLVNPWFYANYSHTTHQLAIGAVMIMLTSMLKAIPFPIAHHLGADQSNLNLGKRVSRVYVSNIMGATLGPLFTGVFLLAFLSTQQSFVFCAAFTFFLAAFCFISVIQPIVLSASLSIALCVFGFLLTDSGDRLIKKVAYLPNISRVIENPEGIITIHQQKSGGDIIAGGNVYDGRTNLDPVINSNLINRVLILSVLHDQPEHVLMIGLSIGTWLKLVTSFSGVKDIDVVEINPGYLLAIQSYKAQASALLDPRVHMHIDDGRRWLKLHPANRYDMIIMNNTYYWRAYSANLLSIEFLKCLKTHMNRRAILAYNSTGSPDALKTTVEIFNHAYLYQNFIVAADFDWRDKLHSTAAEKTLATLMLDRKLLFPADQQFLVKQFLRVPIVSLGAYEPFYHLLGRRLEVITDDNMITEFKYGKRLSDHSTSVNLPY